MTVESTISFFMVLFALTSFVFVMTLKSISDDLRELNKTLSKFLTKEEIEK